MGLKFIRIIMLFVLYLLFHLMYINIITVHFSYEGFTNEGINQIVLFEHVMIISVLILLQLFMKNEFYNLYIIYF